MFGRNDEGKRHPIQRFRPMVLNINKANSQLILLRLKNQEDHTVTVKCIQTEGKLSDAERYYRVGLVTESGIQYSGWENDGEIDLGL